MRTKLNNIIELWKIKLKIRLFVGLINFIETTNTSRSFIQGNKIVSLNAVLYDIKDKKIREVFKPFITEGFQSNLISKRIIRGEFVEILKK